MFLTNKYSKTYYNIINGAKSRELYEYYKVKFYKLHSQTQKGVPKWSDEQKRKMSETRKGVPWSEKARNVKRKKPTAKPVLVYRKDDNSCQR